MPTTGLVLLFTVIGYVLASTRAAVKPIKQRGLIVIPGLGRADRLSIVVDNLKSLEEDFLRPGKWNCVVYIYALRSESSFWSMSKDLDYLYSRCGVVENTNNMITENLFMVQPPLIGPQYNKIFILFDDIKLTGPKTSFDLNKLLSVMYRNNLTVVSPQIINANKGGGQKFRNIMQTRALDGTEGYVSTFVEMFAWVMTLPAYSALWDLLCPHINPYGWGYDFWYNGYAKSKVRGHKMGIASSIAVLHEQGAERTDRNAVDDKWNAVLAQEKHYNAYRGVNLQQIRKKLDISNASWNGAVKDFLH